MKTLIVDGNNMAHRALYSYQLSNGGRDVSVTYGMLSMLRGALKEFQPDALIVCFDGGRPGFRQRLFPGYKANRKKDEQSKTYIEFKRQMNELTDILPMFGALTVRRCGIEADDLMAQATLMSDGPNFVLTSDEDLYQTVSENTTVVKPVTRDKKQPFLHVSMVNFQEVTGIWQGNWIAARAFIGDTSDNLPGCKGIGPKTVQAMFANGYLDLDLINVKLAKKVQAYLDKGYSEAVIATDLMTYDRSGARYTLLNAPWNPYSQRAVNSYLVKNAFVSLLENGALTPLFGRLRAPEFDLGGRRAPRVWDAPRTPA